MKEKIEKDLIHKSVILKNFLRYTEDKALLKTLLDKSNKDEFTETEILEILKNEMKREV